MRTRLLVALLVMLAAPVARASVVVPLGLGDLVDKAEQVTFARVESQEARWTSAHDAIYTEVTLRVLDSAKGDARPGDVITLRREGGIVDGIGMKVWGAASFMVGEEVVVFAERRGQALWTVGMSQGKLHVDYVNGQRVALRQSGGLAYLPGAAIPADVLPSARPLRELLVDVAARAALAPRAPTLSTPAAKERR